VTSNITNEKIRGMFTFVLHSHLPYVIEHGKWPHGMDWLNEAAAETYLPLLDVFYQLVQEGFTPKVTIGITPILAEQLSNPLFKEEFKNYLKLKINAGLNDKEQFKKEGKTLLTNQAQNWIDFYTRNLRHFENKYNEDIIGAFKKLQDNGAIEIITCAATHGYLPLLGTDNSVKAQIQLGVDTYKKHFDRQPNGFWLPECAYRPGYNWKSPIKKYSIPFNRIGIEEFLSDNGIKYFIIDTAMLKGGEPIGVYIDRFKTLRKMWEQFSTAYKPAKEDITKSPYKIYLVGQNPNKCPVAILTRDPKTSLQVWSGEHGYPGDGNYLEFHKKHFPGGLRYWKITSSKADLGSKEEYNIDNVDDRLRENAGHFKQLVKDILSKEQNNDNPFPVLVAPYDTELLGHWWFEGPRWIYYVLRWMNEDPEMMLATGSEMIDQTLPETIVSIPEGSWGKAGFHWVWLNEDTKWTWQHIYEDEQKFAELIDKYGQNKDATLQRILKQIARELLLEESSDWQFLITTQSARDYAEIRIAEHHDKFKELVNVLDNYISTGSISQSEFNLLTDLEQRDAVFDDIDTKYWELEQD